MNLSSQKRMAADVLDVGKNRVWIDPDRIEDVESAITKQDVRNLVESGVIRKKDETGQSRGRARKRTEQKQKGRQSGHGSRRGTKGARKSGKENWTEKIRALRDELKALRDDGTLEPSEYRELYDMASGGFFRNRKHMKLYIEKNYEA